MLALVNRVVASIMAFSRLSGLPGSNLETVLDCCIVRQ